MLEDDTPLAVAVVGMFAVSPSDAVPEASVVEEPGKGEDWMCFDRLALASRRFHPHTLMEASIAQ